MLEFQHITKRFGAKTVLNDVSFVAEDGKVTGFLGPNGAGKSTTMRCALNLIHANSGTSLIDGKPYAKITSPMTEVGAVLDAKSAHRGRTAYNHLYSLALTHGISKKRVDEVIDITGLTSVKNRKAGSFSLGMGQRLSIAAALLADPHNLILDEPVNGLDPEGVKWVRELCKYYASQGRAILLSSHLMSEVALTADNLVIIAHGEILERTTVQDFVNAHSQHAIRLVTPEGEKLKSVLAQNRPECKILPDKRTSQDAQEGELFKVTGCELNQLAREIADNQIMVYQLNQEHASLEEAYLALTHGQEQYVTKALPNATAATGTQYADGGSAK
ncbi:ATP-binding cassette domain-containing protein [Gardnerella swidsinskii]|uniref:ATP-binding cassette domain-containing protein n=1 Tax=Gardnerella TaxID=2701 RepID=UPI002586848F|nr:ATP-binding cassette domain-containing protein [uncultured Gardnerella sp.]